MIDDRFDAIELRFARPTFGVALDQLDTDREVLVQRAAATRRVRQQWTVVTAPFPAGRIELVRPGDAALVDLRRRCAIVLSRRRGCDLQEVAAPLPIRALRAGRLPERHDVLLYATSPDRPGTALHSADVTFDRCGDAWMMTWDPWQSGDVDVQVAGVAIEPGEIIAIDDGAGIHSEHWSFALITQDVTATVRALLA